MERLDTTRIFFQLLALGIFIFQLQNSITKYFSKPIVQQTSIKSLIEIDKPLIYVCQNGQFSNKKANKYGYDYLTDFATGELNNAQRDITWKGKDKNSTFQNLVDTLFNYNYSDIEVEEYSDGDWIGYTLELEYNVAYGFCMSSKMMYPDTSLVYLASTQSISFFLVDPARQNRIVITFESNAKGSFEPNFKNLFNYRTYQLNIALRDSQIYEGTKCTDYVKRESSYGECVENAMKDLLINSYGCLPPWFVNNTGLSCEEDKEIHTTDIESKKRALKLTYMLALGLDIELLLPCLKPCLTMDLQLKEMHFEYQGKLDLFLSKLRHMAYLTLNILKK